MEAQQQHPFPLSPQPSLQNFQSARNSLSEEFSTPRSQFDSLPEITANPDLDHYGFPSVPVDAHNDHPPLPPQKSSAPRPVSRHDDARKQGPPHLAPPRTKKLSKPRQPHDTTHAHASNASTSTLPGIPDGTTTTTTTTSMPSASSSASSSRRVIHKAHSRNRLTAELEPPPPSSSSSSAAVVVQVDEETIRKAGIPLDDDPFARVEGVKMLKPSTRQRASKENLLTAFVDDAAKEKENGVRATTSAAPDGQRQKREKKEKIVLFDASMKREPPTFSRILLDPLILAGLLQYLSFYEWCIMLSLSKDLRSSLVRTSALRETALERFLKTVGYARWAWADAAAAAAVAAPDPLSLSLQDLNDYMRGVSTPTHEYARVARMYVHSLKLPTTHRDPAIRLVVQQLVASTRAYNRVLVRLRAQLEKEAAAAAVSERAQLTLGGSGRGNVRLSPGARGGGSGGGGGGGGGGGSSRPSSRAPSPAASYTSFSINNSGNHHGHGNGNASASQTNLALRSPLFKLRRAPLLRVFVPSPEGDWLSDKSVLECEAECRRAGVVPLLRLGDVVWDVAVGDEGNVGRLVWDGTYLIVSCCYYCCFIYLFYILFLSGNLGRILITRTRRLGSSQSTCTRLRFRLRTSIG